MMSGRSYTADARERGDVYDMELVVEGKKVKVNSGLLSCRSSVFATLISNARATQADDNDVTDRVTQRLGGPLERKLKLEMPNLLYKDVKTMIACLHDSGELTGSYMIYLNLHIILFMRFLLRTTITIFLVSIIDIMIGFMQIKAMRETTIPRITMCDK